jgi:drug/metabolite transporter (DMT)-like permease
MTLLIGNIVIFVAGIGAAFFNIYGKKLLGEFTELQVLVYSYVSGCVAFAIVSLLMKAKPFYQISSYPSRTWIVALVLGLSAFTLRERLTLVQASGGGLVLLATYLTSEWESRRSRLDAVPDQNLASPQPEEQCVRCSYE